MKCEGKIIKGAIEMISKVGFANFKMVDLSATSKISTVTIRSYFKTKDDLLSKIIRMIWDEIMVKVNLELVGLVGKNPIDIITGIFVILCDYLEVNEKNAVIILRESRNRGIQMPVSQDAFMLLLRSVLKSGQEKRILKIDLMLIESDLM